MRIGKNIQTLTSVDIQQIAKIGGKVIEFHERVNYQKIVKISPFKELIDELFALRQKYKDDNNEVMQLLIKLIMNALYGEFLRTDILESYECQSEAWMMRENDERVLDYHKNKLWNLYCEIKR